MNKSTPAVNGASPLEQTAVVIRGDEHTVLFPQRVAGKGNLVDGAAQRLQTATRACHTYPSVLSGGFLLR